MKIEIVGSVVNIIHGLVTPDTLHKARLQFGLGSGTLSDEKKLGETLFIDGVGYVSWMENGKIETLSKKEVLSPFLMGTNKTPENLRKCPYGTLKSLYESLIEERPNGFAILAQVFFEELHSTFIKRPPVDGVNINDNPSEYWAEIPPEKNKQVTFFGVVTKDPLPQAFYQNPREANPSDFFSHTHGAILSKGQVQSIRHLLTDSVMQEGSYSLFDI